MTEKIDKRGQIPKSFGSVAVAETALIVAICMLVAGDPVPAVNEPHYLCRAKHFWDASYCAGDLFLESPDAHVAFVYSIGWLTPMLPLTAIAWVGRIVCWTLLAAAWVWLVRAIVPKVGYAALAAAIWLVLIAQFHLAGEWVVGGFEAKCIAYPLVLWSLGFAVRERWNAAWICMGAATTFHALVGAWSVLALLVVWLIDSGSRPRFMHMLPGLLVGGMLGLIGVVPALALSRGVTAEANAAAAEIYVFERLAHHLAPLSKPPAWIAERFGWNLVTLGLFLATSLAAVASRGGRSTVGLQRVMTFAAASLTVAVVGLAIEYGLSDDRSTAALLLRYYWLRLADVAVPMAVAIALASLLARLFETRPNRAALMLTAMLMSIGWPLFAKVRDRTQAPIPPAVKAADFADWRDACDWISANTPASALFLTPRGNSTFKWYASRAEVVTHKDVPQDAPTLLEWHRRLNNVYRAEGREDQPFCRSVGQLRTPRIRELASEYRFDYVLTTAEFPLDLQIAFANATYVVYQLNEEM